jgi:hypothetical protein
VIVTGRPGVRLSFKDIERGAARLGRALSSESVGDPAEAATNEEI